MNVKVTGCEGCPMLNREWEDVSGYKYTCNHPNAPSEDIETDSSGSGEEVDLSYVEWLVTPDWCPLNKEPITIEKV